MESIVFGGTYPIPRAAVSLASKDLGRYEGAFELPSAGRFFVSAKEGGLSVKADGRDAVGIFMYPQAERLPSPFAHQIKSVFDSMNRGDFSPLEDMAGREAAQDHGRRFRTFWRDWQERLGRYQGARILFTTPTGSRTSTYLELSFEKGTQVIRAAYREGGPVSFSQGSLPTRTDFRAVAVGSHEFSYFDFRLGRDVAIGFPMSRSDRPDAMVLHLPATELRVPAANRYFLARPLNAGTPARR